MAKEVVTDSENGKRCAYPYASLNKCLEVAAAVAELGGDRTEIQKSVLAHRLEMDEGGAAFSQTIGATKCYGMIEGRGAYTLTDLGREYFLPIEDGEKRRALLKMLKCPEVYERLIDRFDGSRLPTGESLANIIGREYGVSKSWAPRVASLFVSAIRDAGAIDTSGFIRYAAVMHARQVPASAVITRSRNPSPTELASAADSAAPPAVPLPSAETNVWQFRLGEGFVRLETSRELSLSLWQKLSQYVEVLKPDKEKA